MQETEVVFSDADILSCPLARPIFHGKQFALFVMDSFLAGTLPRCLLCMVPTILQFVLNALLSISVFSFFLLSLVAAVLALQTVTAVVMILEKSWIEMFATELGTAIVASVCSYVLCVVAFLAASLAH